MYYESSDFLETADSDTLKQIARTRELTREYYFSDYGDIEKRTSILRELLGGIGENVLIDTPFHCDYGKNIFLGNDVIINMNCTFLDDNQIIIGNHALIAPNVQIYTAFHPTHYLDRFGDSVDTQFNFCKTMTAPVIIGDNVWIGGNVTILLGVKINQGAIIGAGSVVTHDIPPYVIAAGNPCEVIRSITQEDVHKKW